jgi:hypothetical protein
MSKSKYVCLKAATMAGCRADIVDAVADYFVIILKWIPSR